jgi:excisionase family DNA binding protein
MSDLLTIPAAAELLGCSKSLLQKRCKDGTIPSIRVGASYRVRTADLEAWVKHTPNDKPRPVKVSCEDDLLPLIEGWISYLTSVKALSPSTIRTHKGHLRCYLKRMGALGHKNLSLPLLFDRSAVLAVFARIPAKSYAVKYNTYNALLSFGTYLIDEGKLSKEALDQVRPLKPRRQVEARRTVLKADDVPRLFDTILTRPSPIYDNISFAAMVACMVYGGLRVGEVCNLRHMDIDLAARTLTVRHGKGGKDRKVGITQGLQGYLTEYLSIRPKAGNQFFLQAHGPAWEPLMLAKRMKQVSERMNVDITCHGLRRTFATLAANQGRSVNYLRIALGHANLETTQAYLRTSEAEVIESMKNW